jgi:ribonuclease VapC
MQVVAQDAGLVEAAREAFRRYGKGRHPAGLNLGDCASYAVAKARNLPLLFKGNDFPKTDLTAAT